MPPQKQIDSVGDQFAHYNRALNSLKRNSSYLDCHSTGFSFFN